MKKGRIEINREVCKGCEFCVLFCPKKLIKIGKNLNDQGYYPAFFDDPEKKCAACVIFCSRMCPEAAIEVYEEVSGIEMPCDENNNIKEGEKNE